MANPHAPGSPALNRGRPRYHRLLGGLVTFFRMPGDFKVQLYQPKYVK